MFNYQKFRDPGEKLFKKLSRIIVKIFWLEKINPNFLTLIGLGLNFLTAYLIIVQERYFAGLMLIIASLFDTFDGTVARLQNKVTNFGKFIDSVSDRISEGVVLSALVFYYACLFDYHNMALILVILVASFCISYIRSKAESLGIECKEGFIQRPERVIGILLILFLPQYERVLLYVLAVLSIITVLQRVNLVIRNFTQMPEK